MSNRRLLVVPTAHGVGLTSVCLGIFRALDRLGIPVGFLKPIRQSEGPDRSTALIKLVTGMELPEPIPRAEVERLLGLGDDDILMERVVSAFNSIAGDRDVIVVEGMIPGPEITYSTQINVAIAKALDAELVLVGTPLHDDPVKVADTIDIAARAYGEVTGDAVRSCILNKVALPVENAPTLDSIVDAAVSWEATVAPEAIAPLARALENERLHPLGIIPKLAVIAAPRTKELVTELPGITVINEGDWEHRRIGQVTLCAASVRNAVVGLESGSLVITPVDREDVILAAALATLRGIKLAGVLLTGGTIPDARILELCQPALEAGLPLLARQEKSLPTAIAVETMNRGVAADDRERADLVMNAVAAYLDNQWLKSLAGSKREHRLSAPAFRHQLIELARAAKKRIVLPEGDEPRTIAAAAICAQRGIASCALLGDPDEIQKVATREGVELPDGVEIIDPKTVAAEYVAPMVELRKHKGLTEAAAADQLEDTVVLGTMMLKLDHVDGLVSGAVHTTANTIRPALQLIKTAPGSSLVSSIFFMCLPEQVLVYGDCAVNPDPDSTALAEIAMQSADSAKAFGIDPRVAMISYSTGASGAGSDVEKVIEATKLARAGRPDYLIDGPLQYDAASVKEVAKKKAPDSPVAGRATVFIFPDLNTGNTTYKAVQRSANVVSIGPMLQGLAKPVNDLSRGALVDDIVFTIALTAIQAASPDV